MKVQELRQLLSGAERELLEKAFSECYKQFPKNKKEEVDRIITDTLAGKEKAAVSEKETVNFDKLEMQITDFISNAYAQN